jgi:hypothetical protein
VGKAVTDKTLERNLLLVARLHFLAVVAVVSKAVELLVA